MPLTKTKFRLSKMDCASEEGMVRMALDENTAIKQLQFDLGNRELDVIHDNSSEEVLSKLDHSEPWCLYSLDGRCFG